MTESTKVHTSSSKRGATASFAVKIPDISYPNKQKPLPAMPPLDSDSDGLTSTASTNDPSTKDFRGDLKVSNALPNKAILATAGGVYVLNKEGKKIPFKSLYSSYHGECRKVLIIFIRHFFCGNCQEYLRTLCASITPSSLPPSTSIVVIGCGSPTLIPMYIEQTACPYPIYADPTRRLYNILGMTMTLSLGKKGPDYIQHTLVAGMVKSIVQGVKRIGSGDALQAGDMRQVGGEFLFSSTSRLDEKKSKVEVTWCHRMKNTRDHAEVPVIHELLGLDSSDGNSRSRPQRRWTTANLARTLSNRRSSWMGRSSSFSRSRRRSPSDGSGRGGRSRSRTNEMGDRRSATMGFESVREDVRSRDGPVPPQPEDANSAVAEEGPTVLGRIVSGEPMYAEPEPRSAVEKA